jgi:hypothetical protein
MRLLLNYLFANICAEQILLLWLTPDSGIALQAELSPWVVTTHVYWVLAIKRF